MVAELVPDAPWSLIRPLLPASTPRPQGGRPRSRPDCILGDRAYDAEKIRRALRARHISPLLAMRNTENGSGLGRWRWVIERTFAWLNQFRRLRLRYEKRADMHKAFLFAACRFGRPGSLKVTL
jgi:transposase